MLKRLFYLWIDYRLHHISAVVSRCFLGLVIVGAPSTPVIIKHTPIYHKPASSHKITISKPTNAVKSSNKKVAVAKPTPTTSSPSPQVTAPPPAPVAQPKPVPATQPAPSGGAKKLAPAPATTPPADTSTPTSPDPGTSTNPGSTTSSPATDSLAPVYATGGYTSTNWAGYVATAGNYKAVSGSWVVPSATGNGTTTTADTSWIGIGGVFTGDLIQTGTINTVSSAGQLDTIAFYELLPDSALEIPSLAVSSGDFMSATINEITPSRWNINISDTTTGATFTTTVSYSSSYSSAEWIEEDPSYANGSLVPFDNFTPATFSNGATTTGGLTKTIAAANSAPITLVDQKSTPLARPTVLSTDGSGFKVYRQ